MGSVVVLLLLVFERKRPLPLTCLSVCSLSWQMLAVVRPPFFFCLFFCCIVYL